MEEKRVLSYDEMCKELFGVKSTITDENGIVFADEEHKQFYYNAMSKVRQDCYHKALFYLLGINSDTRAYSDKIYNFENRCINSKSINQAWVTSCDVRTLRLAFNLFTAGIPEERNKEMYAVSEIFAGSTEYHEFYIQAIKLRYGS
jgi:hypothetical protein